MLGALASASHGFSNTSWRTAVDAPEPRRWLRPPAAPLSPRSSSGTPTLGPGSRPVRCSGAGGLRQQRHARAAVRVSNPPTSRPNPGFRPTTPRSRCGRRPSLSAASGPSFETSRGAPTPSTGLVHRGSSFVHTTPERTVISVGVGASVSEDHRGAPRPAASRRLLAGLDLSRNAHSRHRCSLSSLVTALRSRVLRTHHAPGGPSAGGRPVLRRRAGEPSSPGARRQARGSSWASYAGG